ncbi:helix-turn-helix domain-containing protein [Winogradskyella flava]|uniref:AraC family transcriptional regulator n=1 Tax=Winogradskyella flava TaxID=1884876 RepID=A0A842IV35_9FLAO|nr:helix-turn-helix domain-containing protein [Winogradskyella flava]MBC2846665.1 AraC family transcriptional regulator [Winogradskyella flava]
MQQSASFDTWTSGFLFAVAMGIFLCIIMFGSRNKRNYPIALLVLSFSGILFSYVLYWTKYNTTLPYFSSLPYIGYFSVGPLLYMYLLELYNLKMKYIYAHFALSFLWIGLTLFFWSQFVFDYRLGTGSKLNFLSHYAIITAHLSLYLFLMVKLIRKSNGLDSEFKKIRFKWVRILIGLFALFLLSYISYYILINFSFFNNQWDYMISFSMTLAIYTIGYFVYKEPQIFDGEFISEVFLPIENKKDSFEDNLINEFYNNLVNYIESEKPFKDNELRLANLADKVGYSTHLLSKVINKKSGKNFNSFINDYRLLEAEKLLQSNNNDHSVKTIYFDVGFNNKVTFYKAFKNKHNCTPTEYKRGKHL